jgi:hypothetical protein
LNIFVVREDDAKDAANDEENGLNEVPNSP